MYQNPGTHWCFSWFTCKHCIIVVCFSFPGGEVSKDKIIRWPNIFSIEQIMFITRPVVSFRSWNSYGCFGLLAFKKRNMANNAKREDVYLDFSSSFTRTHILHYFHCLQIISTVCNITPFYSIFTIYFLVTVFSNFQNLIPFVS